MFHPIHPFSMETMATMLARSSFIKLEKELQASRCQAGQKYNSCEVMFGLAMILFCDPSFL